MRPCRAGTSPEAVTLEEALATLAAKASGGPGGRAIGEHPDGGPITLRAGRFGAYVNWGKVNATIPKSTPPESITLAEALELLAEREGRPAARARRRRRKAAAKTKKPAAPPKAAARTARQDRGQEGRRPRNRRPERRRRKSRRRRASAAPDGGALPSERRRRDVSPAIPDGRRRRTGSGPRRSRLREQSPLRPPCR